MILKALKAIVTFLEWLLWTALVIAYFLLDLITLGVFHLQKRAKKRRDKFLREAQRKDEWVSGPPNVRDRRLDLR